MKIILAFIWVATMLIYLLGDVLRIFAGDFKPGEVEGKPVSHKMYFGMAIIMVIPIVMVVLSIILEFPVNGWVNIIVAISFFGFNLIGIKGYKAYDIFLLIVSFMFNVLIIWYASARLLI
ncbi:MAG: DUF6326 family protein [Promethearchaeota archaeon]